MMMKPLKEYTNTMKGKLLFDLFPDVLPLFLEHLENVCRDLEENKDQYAKEWNTGLMTFDFWLMLSDETATILKKHKFSMKNSSQVFSDQLFFGYTSLFVNDRIIKYANHISENEKFRQAVILLYA